MSASVTKAVAEEVTLTNAVASATFSPFRVAVAVTRATTGGTLGN